jgi:monoamine oxidase
MMTEEILDVAVVGGGVSGVYAAWRLLTKGGKGRVAMFEASDHIGGRLLSVTPPHIPYMKAELGGMRILPAVQPRIAQLIKCLNRDATPDESIETYPFPVDQPANISYLRGVHLRLSDFLQASSTVPYHLTFQERGKMPSALVMSAIEQIVPGITDPNLHEDQRRERARATSFNGQPLYQQGFWQVLMRVVSGEAYQLAMAAGGYETTLTNWNAADAIPWYLSDFGVKAEFTGFKRGFQQVPLTIAERVKQAGGSIECNAQVTSFQQVAEGIELHFQHRPPVQAKALILAMPRRSLELIAPQTPLLQQEHVIGFIQSVTPRPLLKLFTTYLYPWWLPAGVKKGRTTTDLPIRQTYYWPKEDGAPALEGRAMLMASYDDGLNIGFWDGFRPKRGRSLRPETRTILEPAWFTGTLAQEDNTYDGWLQYRAPAAMVAEVQRQLAVIHGLQFTPEVMDASFKDWGDDPFGGGWNSWNIGVKSWEVKEQILKPIPHAPVYICGEAYSDAQGWVEGALQTADLMLQKYFDILPLVEEEEKPGERK